MPKKSTSKSPAETEVSETEVGETEVGDTKAVAETEAVETGTTEAEPADAEAPLNRAERRARKKGGTKPASLGAFPVGGRQNMRHDNPAHTRRQWATRRSG